MPLILEQLRIEYGLTKLCKKCNSYYEKYHVCGNKLRDEEE